MLLLKVNNLKTQSRNARPLTSSRMSDCSLRYLSNVFVYLIVIYFMLASRVPWIVVTNKYVREPFRFNYICDYLINVSEDTTQCFLLLPTWAIHRVSTLCKGKCVFIKCTHGSSYITYTHFASRLLDIAYYVRWN